MERKSLILFLSLGTLLLAASGSEALFGRKKSEKSSKAIFEANKEWTEERFKWESVHRPMRYKDCAGCHASPDDMTKLLWPQRKLCAKCHEGVVKTMEGGTPGLKIHAALKDVGCAACHDPHASQEKHLLKKDVVTLCLSCHEAAKAPMKAAHAGTTKFLGSCLACHNGHAAKTAKLIPDITRHPGFEGDSCNTCHTPPLKTGETGLAEDLSKCIL
jgi:predicted CXXCH cytochrome family protein